jgi:hypothetical protein
MPSAAVVRSVITAHDPGLLELMDGLKERFGARLLTLQIPAAGIKLGPVERCQREYERAIPVTPGYESPAQVAENRKAWKRAQQARRRPRK